jgi:hypothetical protein
MIRLLNNLKTLSIKKVPLHQFHLKIIKNLIWWRKDSLKKIEISECKLVDKDIMYLFMTNLKLRDLTSIIKLKFYNN